MKSRIRWFSAIGCVVEGAFGFEIFVGGMLIGAWDKTDTRLRNALVVTLSRGPDVHLGRLAKAFRLSSERLRQLRQTFEAGGLAALSTPARIGRTPKVTRGVRRKLEAMFESWLTIDEAHKKARSLGRSTVGQVHTAWKKRQREAASAEEATSREDAAQGTLPGVKRMAPPPRLAPEAIVDQLLHSASHVQHAGTWLMLGMLHAQGLYATAERACEERVASAALRVAIDAVVIGLTLGQKCVEGVRRVATPTAPLLLRARASPSPPTVRAIMRELSHDLGAVRLHIGMVGRYLRSRPESERGVYYVDNHMRPYTGKRVVRRGWRMQDKRVRPGISDYYVHDESGRPLFRVDVPSHDSLTQWLGPLAKTLRDLVGRDERVLLAFDRGGAFAEVMAQLRDDGFEWVTYERRPFPTLPESAFSTRAWLGDELVRLTESRINLGLARGRVRRIAVREDDGHQVNIVAGSVLPAARLIEVMRGRWNQENAFKHGVERWGLNQLDRRRTEAYPPDTVVPNPARGRLDRALRAAAIRDGDARRHLAQLAHGDPRRVRLQGDLEAAIAEQRRLEEARARTPKRAPLRDTELAGKLVRHDGRVNTVLDAIRIACANVEATLADELASHLPKPREAKKTLANLFAAPARVRVGPRTVAVDLEIAATQGERRAFASFLDAVNRRGLVLPGDQDGRRLRFRVQIQ